MLFLIIFLLIFHRDVGLSLLKFHPCPKWESPWGGMHLPLPASPGGRKGTWDGLPRLIFQRHEITVRSLITGAP